MQDFMEKKQERDFTAMNKYIFIYIFIVFSACGKQSDDNQDPINDVPVNITINLSLPAYFHLQNVGTHVYESGGVKGVVLVHHTDDNFYAFDRACSFQPSLSTCSRIEVDSLYYQFRCGQTTTSGFQKCCDSRFFFDGNVAQSPARYPLKSYRVSRSGNILYITN